MKTSELTGAALDWAVAKCEELRPLHHYTLQKGHHVVGHPYYEGYDFGFTPSSDWSQGGPIIEREGIYLRPNDTATEWAAGALRKNRLDKKPGLLFYAKTPLIAAMRCFVASRMGDEVDVPEELR